MNNDKNIIEKFEALNEEEARERAFTRETFLERCGEMFDDVKERLPDGEVPRTCIILTGDVDDKTSCMNMDVRLSFTDINKLASIFLRQADDNQFRKEVAQLNDALGLNIDAEKIIRKQHYEEEANLRTAADIPMPDET